MRIISMSDIQGDFETLDKALPVVRTSDAEVLAMTGDLSGSVFEEKEKPEFLEASKVMRSLMPQVYQDTQRQVRTVHDTAEFLLSNKVKASDELKKAAGTYLLLEKQAREKMLTTYREFRQRFNDLHQKVILVPGEWDGKCIDDVLAHENIHNKIIEEVNGIEFVGYGGAGQYPAEIPIDLTTDFFEREALEHLSKYENAEVALVHECPNGFEGNGKYSGNFALLAYLFRNRPSLILTGHSHSPFVAREPKTGTFVINPGNLGRYENQDFGTFLELEIDKDFFVKPIRTYKVNGEVVITKEFSQEPATSRAQ